MPGPAPKHPSQRRRTNSGPAMLQLPASGRPGDPPEWPLSRPRAAELKVWAELWALPQAVMWERLQWVRAVARYVRHLLDVEVRNPSTRILAEVRQMEDRLGLTPTAMMKLHWEIAPDEVAEARKAKPERLRLIEPATG